MKLLIRLACLGLCMMITAATVLAGVNDENPAGSDHERTPELLSGGFDQFNFLPIAVEQDDFPCRFQEEDGVVIMEVESAEPDTTWWEFRTAVPGYTGTGYYRWIGPEQHTTPGVGVLNYPFRTQQAADYLLRIHNYHDHPETDLENDVFVSLDGEPWIKVFSFPNNVWNWWTSFDPPGPGHMDAIYYDVPAGNHLFQISARSFNFRIDRITLFRFNADGLDLSLPESPCI